MTPEQQAIIISGAVQGVPQRAVGEALGVSHTTIQRHQAKLRERIQREAEALLQRGLIPARRTVCRLAAVGNRQNADKDDKKLALDASKIILGAASILPAHTQSVFIGQLIQGDTHLSISPQIISILTQLQIQPGLLGDEGAGGDGAPTPIDVDLGLCNDNSEL